VELYRNLLRHCGVSAPWRLLDHGPGDPAYEAWAGPLRKEAARDGLRLEETGYVRDSYPHWTQVILLARPDGSPYDLPKYAEVGTDRIVIREMLRVRREATYADWGKTLVNARRRAASEPVRR
jgi:hypothetical protein